jgi:glutathione S-transferase
VIKLYDHLASGNGYKVRLLLSRLAIPFERIELDINAGETRTAEFLARNPSGRIPLVELDDGAYLAESGAILFYFAQNTAFLPDDPLARAEMLQWMFFEQYEHEPNIAVARHWLAHGAISTEQQQQLADKQARGVAALTRMEGHLGGRQWFVGGHCSIADIALYAYTHVAAEGGFELAPFRHVNAWLERMAGEPGHIPITQA